MFITVLSNVALMLFYMLLGFIACKTKKAYAAHSKSLSGILIYILGPAMIINSFLRIEYSSDNISKMIKYFFVSLLLQILFFLILYIIFKNRYKDAKYRILSLGAVLGNVGYFGMPVIQGIFPDEPIVTCYSSINVTTMNLLVFTIGVFLITNDKKYISLKSAFLNPTTLSLFVAIPIFVLGIQLPTTVNNSVELLAKMVTPMCMLILGIRLATADLKIIFTRGFAYLTCLFKLILFPLFAYYFVKWMPIDDVAKTTVFVLAATPSGAIIESLSELHECEQELSANVVLLTTLLTIFTMPLLLLLLIK